MSSGESKKLVLFDIDHTLLEGSRMHYLAFLHAFREVLEVTLPDKFPAWHGYTDLQIIYSFMDIERIPRDDRKVQEIIQSMIDFFVKQDLKDMRLLDGVEDLLKELSIHEDIIIGLVTGNLEDIAYAKLKHLRIDEYFVLGGFGQISAIRSDLVLDAIKKAGKFGKIDKKDVFVIGDTSGDIAAARGAGTKAIIVCTGHESMETLKSLNPDFIFKDLKDTNALMDVIENE